MREFQTIKLQPAKDIWILSLSRPEAMNAINGLMVEEMDRALDLAAGDRECRILILTGSGRAFCAGSDISSLAGMNSRRAFEHINRLIALISRLESIRPPVIAAVNGPCFGGGLELALGCTLRVAAESVRMGLPEPKIGVIPGAGGIERLGRIIGFGRAARVVMTGEPVTAEQAFEIGLVNAVCPDGEAVNAALELASAMLKGAPLAIEATKRCLYATREMSVERGTEYSMHECCLLFDTEDKTEGAKAFLEKRNPEFKGT